VELQDPRAGSRLPRTRLCEPLARELLDSVKGDHAPLNFSRAGSSEISVFPARFIDLRPLDRREPGNARVKIRRTARMTINVELDAIRSLTPTLTPTYSSNLVRARDSPPKRNPNIASLSFTREGKEERKCAR